MYKIFGRTVERKETPEQMRPAYINDVTASKKDLMDWFFALAKASKVTPNQLAKFIVDGKPRVDYAKAVQKAIGKHQEKALKKFADQALASDKK